jgi:phospholipase C
MGAGANGRGRGSSRRSLGLITPNQAHGAGSNGGSGIRLTRRQLLERGLFAAGAMICLDAAAADAAAGAAMAAPARGHHYWSPPIAHRRPDSLPFPHRPAGTDTLPEIEHIVVLMMENHSYDNYLGMLGRGDGFTLGHDGRPTNWNPTSDGRRQVAFLMPNDCQMDGKPSQEWKASHEQYAGGSNQGFVTSPSGPVAMGYWDETRLPFYYSLATTFPVADRWFCSLLGQTYPNRRYLTAATSAGMVDDVIAQVVAKPPNGTIFERLEHYGITWRDYYHVRSLPTVDVWFDDPSAHSPNVQPVDRFFTDASAGTLPGFCIVDPDFGNGSEENPQDIAVGEAFSAQVVNAVMQGPGWHKTLLVWTYDEHGGYYDHVPPPPALAPDPIQPKAPVGPEGEPAYDGFRRYGFRVPAAVVSPYARRRHVTHTIHDHTSILAMVERKWNLPALTCRDANAADLTDFLDLRRPAFETPPVLAAPAAAAQACAPGDAGSIPPPGTVVPSLTAGRQGPPGVDARS